MMTNREHLLNTIATLRPVMNKCDESGQPEFIWMAQHKNESYHWFAGIGDNSVEAFENLEQIVKLIEEE